MRTRRRWLVAVSLAVHLVVVLGLFVAGFWRLERLEAGKHTISIAVAPPPPPAPAGSPAAAPPTPFTHKPRKIVEIPVQPPEEPPPIEAPAPTPAGSGTGSGSGSGGGSGSGEGSGSGADPRGTGDCTIPPCGDAKAAHEPEPKVEEKRLVPPPVLKGLRLQGDTQIHPSDVTKTQMLRAGHSTVSAAFEVCIGTSGGISSVRTLHSSTYSDYDGALTTAIRAWRYRPYLIGGRPVPVCGVVTFNYEIH